MTLLIVAWLTFGVMNWVGFTLEHRETITYIDYLVGVPVFLVLGPITTIQRIFNR